jgi:hypothetical protein
MKTTLLCLAFVASLFTSLATHAQTTASSAIQIGNVDEKYGKLRAGIELRHLVVKSTGAGGSLLFRGNTRGGNFYLYRKNGGMWTALAQPIEDVNQFLTDAVEPEDAKSYLDQQLLGLLRVIMADPNSDIIDDSFVANYQEYVPSESPEKFRALISKREPNITDDKWVISVNIATPKGGVEHWEITGVLAPLQISAIKRVLVHPAGWYIPLVVTGG